MAVQNHLQQEHQAVPELELGIRAAKITFLALVATAILQGFIAAISGSAALLADTVHGLSNGLTTLPLWIAFSLARKKPTQRFPYGYYKAEDLAGLFILVFIAASAVLVGYESFQRLLEQRTPTNLPWAIAAGALGFVGNEAIAQYRIRIGKKIDSAALIADGHHARVDGLGSLAVVLGLAAVAAGIPIADPAAGLVITALIVYLLVREAGPPVISRALDRIDPALITSIREETLATPGVVSAHDIRARWLGHRLSVEMSIGVDANISVAEGHQIAENANHQLRHSISKILWCNIHVEPFENGRPAFNEEYQETLGNPEI